MPTFFLEGKIIFVDVRNVKGKDKTEDFTYYVNFVQYADKQGNDKLLEVNSKEDYRDRKNTDGVAIVTAYKQKADVRFGEIIREATLYKLSLSDFQPANSRK